MDSLQTQKDCLQMHQQLMGIERYLLSMPEEAKVKSLLKQVELTKKAMESGVSNSLKRKKDICMKRLERRCIGGSE